MWCFAFMVLLSHRWIGLTAELQETNRQERLSRHLDWQAADDSDASVKRKKGLFRR
jgi:hypothetical protein